MKNYVRKAASGESVSVGTLRLKNILEETTRDAFLCKVFLHANNVVECTLPFGLLDAQALQQMDSVDPNTPDFASNKFKHLGPHYYVAKQNFLDRHRPLEQTNKKKSKNHLRIV